MDDGSESYLEDQDFPALFRRADRSSVRAQRWFLVATGAALSLVLLAAVMGAVPGAWPGWVGVAAFAAAILVGALAVTQNLERTWYDGRALAESTKSLTWLYVARGGRLAGTDTADEAFRGQARDLRAELERLDFKLTVEGTEISDRMRALRAEPLEMRRSVYIHDRLREQIGYYRCRGAKHRRSALRFRWATAAAQVLGLVGAVLKATSSFDVDLLGIGAAAAAALTAWLQTRDHTTLARAYEVTAADLDEVAEDVPPTDDERQWAAFVADAETSMSREHVMWRVRRVRTTG